MNICIFTIEFILIIISTVIPVAFSQNTDSNTSDRFGDYYSNDAPQKGTLPANSKLMPGSLWLVVTTSLNCRSGAGIAYPIVMQFSKGDVLQAEVGRGGADEVLMNSKDNKGQPWMAVRSKEGSYNIVAQKCYIRANSSYIKPK